MKCKLFTGASIEELEKKLNAYLKKVPDTYFVESKLVYTCDTIDWYTAMIIVKEDFQE